MTMMMIDKIITRGIMTIIEELNNLDESSLWLSSSAVVDDEGDKVNVVTFSIIGNSLGRMYGWCALFELDFLRNSVSVSNDDDDQINTPLITH